MYFTHDASGTDHFNSLPEGQNFKMITNAKHEESISVWPECFKLIKTSGIYPSRCFALVQDVNCET